MLNAICDLLFCPEFTVAPNKNAARDEVDDLSSLDSCEYIWASGKEETNRRFKRDVSFFGVIVY